MDFMFVNFETLLSTQLWNNEHKSAFVKKQDNTNFIYCKNWAKNEKDKKISFQFAFKSFNLSRGYVRTSTRSVTK